MLCARNERPAPYRAYSFSQRHHIREQAVRARNAGRQLSKPRITRVDKEAFARLRYEQAAIERFFLRVVARQNRRPGGIPLVREIKPALLHPSLEIFRRNFIRRDHEWMIGGENAHFGIFVRNAVARNFQRIWSHLLGFEISRRVVLRDRDSSTLYIGKQLRQPGGTSTVRVVSSDSQHYGRELRQVLRRDIGFAQP